MSKLAKTKIYKTCYNVPNTMETSTGNKKIRKQNAHCEHLKQGCQEICMDTLSEMEYPEMEYQEMEY